MGISVKTYRTCTQIALIVNLNRYVYFKILGTSSRCDKM